MTVTANITYMRYINAILLLLVLVLLVFTIPRPDYVLGESEIYEFTIEDYAKNQVEYRFGEGQWESFYQIIKHESQWKHTAQNPTSTAYGLCQTMMSLYEDNLDEDFRTNPVKQINWCIDYTQDRYDTPKSAWSFWKENRYW